MTPYQYRMLCRKWFQFRKASKPVIDFIIDFIGTGLIFIGFPAVMQIVLTILW